MPDIIYYAHPMSWYNTRDELLDIAAIAELGLVSNPNSVQFQAQVDYAKRKDRPVMDIFANYIANIADAVAFRRLNDGTLTAGVAREVFEAIIWGKPVLEVTTDEDGNRWVKTWIDPSAALSNLLTVPQTKDAIERGVL